MRTDILERKDEILQWIEEEQPKVFIAKQLGCKQETLNSYLKKMGIEYAGQQNKKGQQKGPNTYKPASEYLGTNKSIKSHELKLKLIKDGIKDDKCEICGIKIWQGVELPLELHHKDGNHFNNNLDNLMILCPNCHSIQNGNSAKNIGNYIKEKKKNYCIDCGKEISIQATRCEECYHKNTKGQFKIPLNEMPITREELKEKIRTIPFVQIANEYNVSDKAITKWCKKFNLPSKKSDIKSYSDKQWEEI